VVLGIVDPTRLYCNHHYMLHLQVS